MSIVVGSSFMDKYSHQLTAILTLVLTFVVAVLADRAVSHWAARTILIELGKREVNSRQYVSWYNFGGQTSRSAWPTSRAASATASTSRGCCARAATYWCSTSRPTTSTCRHLGALEEALLDFVPGLRGLIAHDRWFLDRVATAHPLVRGRLSGHVVRGNLG